MSQEEVFFLQVFMDNKSTKFFGLYNSIHGRLLSYIMTMVHNQTASEDLLQETAAIMWENFDQFQEGTNFAAWAIAIARNKTLEYLRENQKTKKLFQSEFYEKLSYVAEESADDHSVRIKALDNCIKKLSDNNHKLISLRYKHNVPIKNISLKTGRPISTLYLHISQILGLLRICISKFLAEQDA